MSTGARSDARIRRVEVTDEAIIADLVDGRVISVPLAWSWRLAAASPAQRARYEIIGNGQGVQNNALRLAVCCESQKFSNSA